MSPKRERKRKTIHSSSFPFLLYRPPILVGWTPCLSWGWLVWAGLGWAGLGAGAPHPIRQGGKGNGWPVVGSGKESIDPLLSWGRLSPPPPRFWLLLLLLPLPSMLKKRKKERDPSYNSSLPPTLSCKHSFLNPPFSPTPRFPPIPILTLSSGKRKKNHFWF